MLHQRVTPEAPNEEDLSADVARLREKWFGAAAKPLPALDDEEQAVAAKWLGKSEAARLARTRPGERFRYRPAVVVAHYGYIPPAQSNLSALPLGDYWYVEVFKQGRKYTLLKGTREQCLRAVARLERMRISITRVGSERSAEEGQRTAAYQAARKPAGARPSLNRWGASADEDLQPAEMEPSEREQAARAPSRAGCYPAGTAKAGQVRAVRLATV